MSQEFPTLHWYLNNSPVTIVPEPATPEELAFTALDSVGLIVEADRLVPYFTLAREFLEGELEGASENYTWLLLSAIDFLTANQSNITVSEV